MENGFEKGQAENVAAFEDADNTAEVTEKADKNPYEELFTPEEIKLIEEYAGKISVTDENVLAGFGLSVQRKAADIVAAAAMGAEGGFGDTAVSLMEELARLIGDMESPEGEKAGILGIFKTKSGKLAELSKKYELAEPVADEVSLALDADKEVAATDAKALSELYDACLNCIKELTMYIAAGKMKLKSERDVTLVKICEFAKNSGETSDIDAASASLR